MNRKARLAAQARHNANSLKHYAYVVIHQVPGDSKHSLRLANFKARNSEEVERIAIDYLVDHNITPDCIITQSLQLCNSEEHALKTCVDVIKSLGPVPMININVTEPVNAASLN